MHPPISIRGCIGLSVGTSLRRCVYDAFAKFIIFSAPTPSAAFGASTTVFADSDSISLRYHSYHIASAHINHGNLRRFHRLQPKTLPPLLLTRLLILFVKSIISLDLFYRLELGLCLFCSPCSPVAPGASPYHPLCCFFHPRRLLSSQDCLVCLL